MVYRRTGRPTGRPKKDRTAELMEAAPDRLKMLDRYRARPSDWLKDCINIDPAHYRNEAELVRWLETQPLERHEWCRRQLAAGTLILDPTRSYQEEFLDTMAAPGQYAFQCANGTAKTATASLAVLWFLDCYPSGRVLTTAGTWSQLKEQLWREIPMWSERVKKAIVPMGQHVNKMGISIGPDWAAFSRAANRAETFEGVHSDYLMVLIDEAKAVKEEIFGSVRRILRGNPGLHFWFICLSSPGSPGGPFWDITNGEQAHRWTTFHLSAYESERISLDQIGQDAEDLGEDSPLFIAMDIGEFPQEGDDTVIPLSWAQANVDRKVLDTGPRWLGIDVARYGCFDDQTEILTSDGWKLFESLKGTELVLGLDEEVARWQQIEKIHRYPYDGQMNLYDGEKVNFCITDNHRLPIVKRMWSGRKGKWKIGRYDEAPQTFMLKRTNTWEGKSPPSISFRSEKLMPHGGAHEREWTFDFYDWAQFLGWYVAEGNVYHEKRASGRKRILVAQKKDVVKIRMIRSLLLRMGLKFRYTKTGQFEFTNAAIAEHLEEHCGIGAGSKMIPRYVKEAGRAHIEAFLDTFGLGDGNRLAGGGWSYATSSRKLADDVQELLCKLGRAGKMSVSHKKGSTFEIDGRKSYRKRDMFTVTERNNACDSDVKKSKVKKVQYTGDVHCVTVPLGTIMVRRKGCTMWSGNSDETCMFGLFGRRALLQAAYNGRDTVWTSGRADELHQQYKYQRIVIDDGGIGGAVTDQLKARGFPIVPVSFGGKEGMLYPDRYVNIKAEIYWMLRLELESGFVDTNNPETGLSLPNDKKLIHQLASQNFSYDLQGRRKMESHAQLAARGVKSPDRADALVLANYGRTGMMARYGSQVQKAMEDSITEGKSMGIAASLIKDMG